MTRPETASALRLDRFGTGDLRLEVEREDSLFLEYPNGVQTQVFDRRAWVRMLVVAGTQVTLVLDSMRSAAIPSDSLRLLDGTTWSAALEDGRRVGPLSTTRRTPLADQLALPLMRDLLPALPAAGIRSGDSWRDSTTSPQRLAGAELPVTVVTEYRATIAPTGRDLDVAGDARVSAKGTSSTFGQPIDVTASGIRRRSWQLTGGGQLLRAEGSDSVAISLDVPSVGQTVPATQLSHFTVTRTGTPR